ncbi:MAG: DMT family transporter [Chloroflexota bacterium]|nr:DMT family transporter [Chloroflexota bacterium]
MTRERAGLAGAGLVVLAASCFGTLGPISRLASDAGVDALGFATWRSGLGALLMIAFLGARRIAGRRELVPLSAVPARSRLTMVVAAIATTTLNLAIFIAFLRISIALSLLIFYLYPALVTLASVLWFGERIDARRWAALVLSLIGMVLVVSGPIGGLDLPGIALAFLAAVSQTVYVLAARHGYGSVPSLQATTFFLAFAGIAYLVIGVVAGSSMGAAFASPAAWPLLLLAGSVGAGLPSWAYMAGIRRIGASRAAILATIEPVVGVLLAALLLSEVPSLLQVAGGVLILAAAVLLQLETRAATADHEALAAAD